MSRLMVQLREKRKLNAFAEILDWLFSERRFEKPVWRTRKSTFTKRLKKVDGIREGNWVTGSCKGINWNRQRGQEPLIIFQCDDAECIDLLRHIRNGIAHGNCEIINSNRKLMLELVDFNSAEIQSAYMWIPLAYLEEWFTIYQEIDNT